MHIGNGSRWDIVYELLLAAESGGIDESGEIERYIDFLSRNGFISEFNGVYKLTEKGFELLISLSKLRSKLVLSDIVVLV